MEISKAEILSFCTTRIESETADGGVATGTGFFFEFHRGHESGKSLTAIVTNKHVIEDSVGGVFTVTMAKQDGLPDIGNYLNVPLPKPGRMIQWIPHPDKDVDLAILPIGPFIGQVMATGARPYIRTLTPADIASDTDLQLVAQTESVTMPGYPQGIFDSTNNQPIFRRGFCATNPSIPYNDSPEFLVDIECHEGSSGSPVLLFDVGQWHDKWGVPHTEGRIKLLGVLYAGFIQSAQGEVIEIPIPTATRLVTEIKVPIGLAKCVSAEKLRDFERLLPDPNITIKKP